MTVDRGGLQYRIEVVDDFSAELTRFRRQLRETRRLSDRVQRQRHQSRRDSRGAREELRLLEGQVGATRQLGGQRQRNLRLAEEELAVARQLQAVRNLTGRIERGATDAQQRRIRDLIRESNERQRLARRIGDARRRDERARAREIQRTERAEARAEATARRRRIRARRLLRQRRRAREEEERRLALARQNNSVLRRTVGFTRRLSETLARSAVVFGAFAAGFAAVEGVRALAEAFVGFNRQIETARLGIAGIFTAVGQVTDASGNLATGARALGLAQQEARRQTELLRRDALQTTATFEQLARSFQEALAPGLTAGLNVDEIRRFAVRISQAATAIGLPQEQLAEEIRSLLAGTITPRTTRIATALGITNEDIRRAREAGRLVEFLNTRFSAFDEVGREAQRTFEALTTNVADALRQLLGVAGAGLFEDLKTSLEEIFDLVVDRDPLTGEILPDPELVRALTAGFDALRPGLDATVGAIGRLQASDLEEFARSLGQLGTFAADLTVTFAGLATEAVNLAAAFTSLRPFGEDGPRLFGSLGNEAQEAERAARAAAQRVQGLASAGSRSSGQAAQDVESLVRELSNVVNISARPVERQAQAFQQLGQAARQAAGQAAAALAELTGDRAGAVRIQLETRNSEQLLALARERATAAEQLENVQRRSIAISRQRLQLSEADQRIILQASELLSQRAGLEEQRERVTRELNGLRAEELRRQRDGVQLSQEASQALAERTRGLEQEVGTLSQREEIILRTASVLVSQGDNRERIVALLRQQLQLTAQVGAASQGVASAANREAQLRERIARAARAQASAATGARLRQTIQRERSLTRQTDQQRVQLQIARQQVLLGERFTQFDRERLQNNLRLSQQQSQLQFSLQEAERELASAVQIQAERLALDQQVDAALEAQIATQAQVVEQLREQLRLTGELSAQQEILLDRRERAAIDARNARQAQQTGGQSGGADVTFGDNVQAGPGVGSLTNALGSISQLVVQGVSISAQQRGEVIDSYSDLFKAIGDVISDFVREIFSPASLLRTALGFLVGGLTGGLLGGAARGGGGGGGLPSVEGEILSGFNEGGPVGGSLPRAAPLPGLSSKDVVPARLAVGEYVQPTSAVRRYGPQVMEAIRRGSIDPFALRALSGARSVVRRPRAGGFQTGGEVASVAPAASSGVPAITQGFIVSDRQQMANLLAGSSEELLDFFSNNAADIRTRLGN